MLKSPESLREMSTKLESVQLDNDNFTVDDGAEKALLNGTYSIQRHRNRHPNLKKVVDDYYNGIHPPYHCKQVYVEGNILYKLNEPNIQDMIDLAVRSTHEVKLPECVDKSVHKKWQKRGGTICPSQETIFRYQGKLYNLYGRYIFGYDKRFVQFTNDKLEVVVNGDEVDDDDEYEDYVVDETEEREVQLTRAEIILPTVPYSENCPLVNDYHYAFSIVDESTGVLDAFGIYC
ncbi:hypothetical protein JYU34_001180 [Plutella xylostella]|uniref:Uncharacterized protein n=1 Tax=Plutella xylostella TaxID=51655 RepID=A0ABQ7R667_PLUXY|nr:hypothetical protein JYU34_001180 [Plutella xylostella]